MVGTDVDSAIRDPDSYCGGYSENVWLETNQNWLNSCSDGFLNCSSQSAAGSVWFTDKTRMAGAELSNGVDIELSAPGALIRVSPGRGSRRLIPADLEAAWFEPGDGMLVLDFHHKHLPAGYGAPFEVRQLDLHDQTRVAPLETRGRGAHF